jgi:hypothetical protein
MRKRNEILDEIEDDETREWVEDCLNEIESEVSHAKGFLDDVNGIGDLHKIEDAHDRLKEVSSALY